MTRLIAALVGIMITVAHGEAIIENVAHRGLWKEAGVPQNTVEAIQAAYAACARTVETDFVETESGEIICIHDVKALATMSSIVIEPKKITPADRERINLGEKAKLPRPYRIPLLGDVLAVVPKSAVLQAEIKEYGLTYAKKFDAAVKAAGLGETNIVVSSFKFDALADFHRQLPKYRTLWLGCEIKQGFEIDRAIARAKEGGFDVLCPGCEDARKAGFTRKDADSIRAAGFDFRLFGVNSSKSLEYAATMGASGFTCNTFIKAYDWAANVQGVKLLPIRKRSGPACVGMFPEDVRTIGIVSVSSVIKPSVFARGTNLLAEAGYRLKVMPNVVEPKVATPEARARLFEEAWLDPEIDLLLFSRGGHGAIDVVDAIDWTKLAKRNMRVVGFSDVTLILNAMRVHNVGHPCLGPMLTTIATYCSEESKHRLRCTLDGKPQSVQLEVIKPANEPIVGLPIGGLLERFVILGDKKLRPSAKGCVVFLENTPRYADKGEELLNRLIAEGAFDGASAVVFCDFNRTWPKAKAQQLLSRFADKVPCPVFAGYPFGHVPESYAIDLTRKISISTDGILRFYNH